MPREVTRLIQLAGRVGNRFDLRTLAQVAGRGFVETFVSLWPALEQRLRALFTSGYTDDAILRHGSLDGAVSMLPKPFSIAEMARASLDQSSRRPQPSRCGGA